MMRVNYNARTRLFYVRTYMYVLVDDSNNTYNAAETRSCSDGFSASTQRQEYSSIVTKGASTKDSKPSTPRRDLCERPRSCFVH